MNDNKTLVKKRHDILKTFLNLYCSDTDTTPSLKIFFPPFTKHVPHLTNIP